VQRNLLFRIVAHRTPLPSHLPLLISETVEISTNLEYDEHDFLQPQSAFKVPSKCKIATQTVTLYCRPPIPILAITDANDIPRVPATAILEAVYIMSWNCLSKQGFQMLKSFELRQLFLQGLLA
jgi:hypothetical protein